MEKTFILKVQIQKSPNPTEDETVMRTFIDTLLDIKIVCGRGAKVEVASIREAI